MGKPKDPERRKVKYYDKNRITKRIKKLGFHKLCDDNKTLVAYNVIQGFLKANRTPIKAITQVWFLGVFKTLHVDLEYGFDVEIGYSYYDEN